MVEIFGKKEIKVDYTVHANLLTYRTEHINKITSQYQRYL